MYLASVIEDALHNVHRDNIIRADTMGRTGRLDGPGHESLLHHDGDPEAGRKRAGKRAGQEYSLYPSTSERAAWWLRNGLGPLLILSALGIGIAALILVTRHDDHGARTCNAGSNAALDLPNCEDAGAVPGHSLIYGDVAKPAYAFARRVAGGVGVDIDPFPDSHILVNVLVESLSPELIVDESGGTPNAVTLELDLAGLNVTTIDSDECSITGNGTAGNPVAVLQSEPLVGPPSLDVEPDVGFKLTKVIAEHACNTSTNLWVEFPHDGHGLCVGDNHTCPNDGTMDRSSILGGLDNAFLNVTTCTIGGGQLNTINNTQDSGVFAGRENSIVSSAQSVIVGGQENLIANVSGGDSVIAGGFGNRILGGDDNFIGGGQDNTVSADESGILAGDGNTILEGSAQCTIVGGDSNDIGNNTVACSIVTGINNGVGTDGSSVENSAILAGSACSIVNASRSSILAGSNVVLSDAVDDSDTAATQNLLVTASVKTIGYTSPVATPYSVDISDYLVLVNTTDLGAVTILLPAGMPDGMNVIVKDVGDANADNISITAQGEVLCPWSGPCALGGTQVLTQQGGAAVLVHTTSGWMVVSSR